MQRALPTTKIEDQLQRALPTNRVCSVQLNERVDDPRGVEGATFRQKIGIPMGLSNRARRLKIISP